MSNYIDERIVEMKFNNKDFEQNVQTTIKTLDQLDKKLRLEDAGKGLEAIQDASSRIDLSNLANNVQNVSDRCSLLGVVADQVIRRLTDAFLGLSQSIVQTVNSLTIDQVGVGFDKYERKVQSVQTIMNATGLSIEEVSLQLDKLNWFTDETSYNFSDMVDNIGKFTNASVPLNLAVTSMIGIADAAGLAGASVEDASHSMEGFSKAIAQGYMSRQNWQWIRTAHMDTTQFKNTLIEAALAAGTLTAAGDGLFSTLDGGTVSVANFEEALKDGWMTTEVMTSALSKFGGTTEEIYKEYMHLEGKVTTSDVIKQIGISTEDLGLKAFKAAQEAKTFTDAINSVKDAVSTGWMVSFEKVFGNYEEARKFWTDVANGLWDVFASGGEARNDMLEEVFGGAFKDFKSAIADAGVSLNEFENSLAELASSKYGEEFVSKQIAKYGSLAEAFRFGAIEADLGRQALLNLAGGMQEVSTETVDLSGKLIDIQRVVNDVIRGNYGVGETRRKALEDLGYSYEYIQGIVEDLYKAGKSSASIEDIQFYVDEIETLNTVIGEENSALMAFINGTEDANASFDDLISNMAKKTGQELVQESIINLITSLNNLREVGSSAMEAVFGDSNKSEIIYSILERVHALTESLILNKEKSEQLQNTFSGLLSIFKIFGSTIKKIFNIFSPLADLFTISGEGILKYASSIGEAITEFANWYDSSEEVSAVTNKLRGYVERFVKVLRSLGTFAKNIGQRIIPIISEKFNNLKRLFENSPIPGFINKISEGLKNLWSNIESIDFGSINADLSWFSDLLDITGETIFAVYGVIRSYLKPYIDKLKKSFSNLKDSASPISEKFSGIRDKIRELKEHIEETGGPIQWLIDLLGRLKDHISDFIKSGGLRDLLNGFIEKLIPIRDRLVAFIQNVRDDLGNIDWGAVLAFSLGFSLVPLILSISFMFARIGQILAVGQKVLSGFQDFFSGFRKGFKSTVGEIAKAAFVFSLAIGVLTTALWVLATKINADDLKRAVDAMATVIVSFTAMVGIIGLIFSKVKNATSAMLAVASFAIAIGFLAASMKLLEDTKFNVSAIGSILVLMVLMVGAAIGLSKLGVKLEGTALYFVSFAAAILVLSIALQKISDIPIEKLEDSMAVILTLMFGLGIITTVSKLIRGSAFGLLGLVVAVAIITQILKQLSDAQLKSMAAAALDNWQIIVGILAAVAILATLTKLGAGKGAASTGVAVALMAASLLLIYEAVKRFGEMKRSELEQGLFVVGILMVLMSMMAALSSIGKGNGALAGVGVAIMAASLIIIYYAVKQFAKINPNDLKKGAGVVAMIMALMALILGMVALTKGVKAGPIISVALVLGALAASIIILTRYSWDQMKAGVLSIGGIILALAILMKTISSKKSSFDKNALIAMGEMIGIIVAIGAAMFLAAKHDWKSLAAVGGGIALCLIAVADACKILSKIEKIDKSVILPLIAMIGAVVAIGFAMSMVAGYSWSSIAASAGGISVCLEAIAGALKIISGTTFSLGNFLGIATGVAAMWVLGYIISKLTDQPWDSFVGVAAGLSIALVAIAGAMRIASGIPLAGTGQAVVAILGGALAIAAIVVGLGAILDLINEKTGGKVDDYLNNTVKLFQKVGEAMGSIVGGAISGFAASATDDLPQIGENIKGFANSLSGINVDANLASSIKNIGDGFSALVAANFWDNVISFLTGGKISFAELGPKFEAMGTALGTLAENSPDSTELEQINNSITVLQKFVDIANQIPAQDGLWQKIIGEQDMGEFGRQLKNFGMALKTYGDTVAELDAAAIADAMPAVDNVVEIGNSIPTTGGIVGLFIGNVDWEKFSDGLKYFGKALKKYGDEVTDVNATAIANSMDPVANVVEIGKKIPKDGGVVSWFTGETDWEKFSDGLSDFGWGLHSFSDDVSDLNASKISEAVGATDNVVAITEKLQDSSDNGNLWAMPNIPFDTWGSNISSFGVALASFGTSLEGFSMYNVTAAKNAITTLWDLSAYLKNDGALLKTFNNSYNTWSGLGSNLSSFGSAIASFGNSVENVNVSSIDVAKNSIVTMSTMSSYLRPGSNIMAAFGEDDNWTSIGLRFNQLGFALVNFSRIANGINHSSIEASLASVVLMNSIADSIGLSAGMNAISSGSVSLSEFRLQLVEYGNALVEFSNLAAEINFENLSAASNLTFIGENLGSSMISGIYNKETDAVSAIANVIDALQSRNRAKVLDFIDFGKDLIVNMAVGLSSGTDDISNAISSYDSVIISEIDVIVTDITDRIGSKESTIISTINRLLSNTIVSIRSSNYSRFLSAGTYLIGGISSGIASSTIEPAISSIMNYGVRAMESYYNAYFGAGYYLVTGISDGIYYGIRNALAAISTLAFRMNDRFLKDQQIASPSKLYAKYGEYITSGLAKGIDGSSDNAESAISGMCDNMIIAISPALDILSRLVNGELEISPQIRPVVDMSDVYASADLINKMFEEQSVAANAKANNVSRNISQYEESRYRNNARSSDREPVSSPIINNYIYTQPGQSADEIAEAVERRMVRSLTQRKVAHVK